MSSDLKLGEYVYVDDYTRIHISRKCPKLNYRGCESKRIKLKDFYFYFKSTPMGEITFCPHCVSDKDYESIMNIFSDGFGKEVDRQINIENK